MSYEVKTGFSAREIRYLKESGFTPESARDYVVEKLKKANLVKEELDKFMVPIDKLMFAEVETILSMAYGYKDQPDEWIKNYGKDFSDAYSFHLFQNMII